MLAQKLTSAIKLHKAKRFDEAEKLYLELMNSHPKDVNCHYLLGSLYHEKQTFSKAEPLLAFAFKAVPDNGDIAYAFAKNLYALNKYDEVRTALQKHLNNKKCFKLYVKCVEYDKSAHKLDPAQLKSWQIMEIGKQAFIQKHFHLAAKYFDYVCSISPKDDESQYLLALSLDKVGQYHRALNIYERLTDAGSITFDVIFNRGVSYYNLDRKNLARDDFNQAIALQPDDIRAYIYLSSTLYELGEKETYLQPLFQCIEHNPLQAPVYGKLCEALISEGQNEEAQRILDEAPGELQHHVDIIKIKSRLLWEHDRSKALALLAQEDTHIALKPELAKRYIQDQQWQNARHTLSILKKQQHFSIETKALEHALKYCQPCDPVSVKADYEALVKEFRFADTAESSDTLEALKRYLEARHQHATHPQSQSVNGGTQISNVLYDADNPASTELLSFIHQSVDRYIDAVHNKATHYISGFSFANRRYTVLEGWSVSLKRDGKHQYHIHPEGALSAVFYIDLPQEIGTSDLQGHLAFGIPEFLATGEENPEYSVLPERGKLVLFPSHVWHGTLPFESDQNRLTIAFDIAMN
ncbi:putative 2OG-Fe(II) oxygenase [Salinimonas chungwhensis]|uniref:putative 2OG-Fe(II) oxygenase n=1 Tax=Salinimonas chungwhensis TaxID=265425 RepID=UPI00037CDEEF|nr:putative 2OG-Fe(II) oxygenase [Salinimonas chungwhensis]